MGKAFPDADDTYAHKPDGGAAFPDGYVKVVPSVPTSQSDRPQLRPVIRPLNN